MRLAFCIEQNVSRFDVPLLNTVFMRVMNGASDLRDEFHRAPDRHRRLFNYFVKLTAFYKLHAEVTLAITLANSMDWHDTGMLQASCRFRFEPKALQVGFARPLTKANDFYSDCAIETLLPRTKHDALTAATDLFQQFVIAQFSEKLGGASCFFIMTSSRSIRFIACGIVDTAGVTALGYRCAR